MSTIHEVAHPLDLHSISTHRTARGHVCSWRSNDHVSFIMSFSLHEFAAMFASQASSHGHGVSLWCVIKRIQQDRFLQSSLPSARYERQRVGVRLCNSPIFEPRFHNLLLNSPLYLQSYLPSVAAFLRTEFISPPEVLLHSFQSQLCCVRLLRQSENHVRTLSILDQQRLCSMPRQTSNKNIFVNSRFGVKTIQPSLSTAQFRSECTW